MPPQTPPAEPGAWTRRQLPKGYLSSHDVAQILGYAPAYVASLLKAYGPPVVKLRRRWHGFVRDYYAVPPPVVNHLLASRLKARLRSSAPPSAAYRQFAACVAASLPYYTMREKRFRSLAAPGTGPGRWRHKRNQPPKSAPNSPQEPPRDTSPGS